MFDFKWEDVGVGRVYIALAGYVDAVVRVRPYEGAEHKGYFLWQCGKLSGFCATVDEAKEVVEGLTIAGGTKRMAAALQPYATAYEDGIAMLEEALQPRPPGDSIAEFPQRGGGTVEFRATWGQLKAAHDAIKGEN